jgi:tetratricopeptide (TPR) repeat protein
MAQDAQGLMLAAPSSAAVAAYDHAIAGYLGYRGDLPQRLDALLKLAPEMPMAQLLKGYLVMLAFKEANLAPATAALSAATKSMKPDSPPRERAHLAALQAWIAGDVEATLRIWEQILSEHPRDVLAFRLHHFTAFWLGQASRMATQVDQILPAFDDSEPTRAALLACKAFAYEELGRYPEAEAAGREAIKRNPGDLWAAHAVAHVLEMQGRHSDGIALLTELEPQWEGGNSLLHHLFWHRGLYHFERAEFAEVLGLYDRHFRNLTSPMTSTTPDLYIDVQNAASMLFRLQRQGVDVGSRWHELADQAEQRSGDCLSAFTLPHWMMALAATQRWTAAERMLDGMRSFTRGSGAAIVRDHALPVCEAILARAKGDPATALVHMRPALDGMHRLGGSHAQQDVLHQLFLDCALAAGAMPDARRVLDHVSRIYTVPASERRGYAMPR